MLANPIIRIMVQGGITSRIRGLLTLGLCLLCSAGSLSAEQRGQGPQEKWTDTQGRVMVASLLQVLEGEAEFRLPNGKKARVALDQFVDADRQRIDAFRASIPFWQKPPRHWQWPERVSLNWLQTEVKVVETGSPNKHVYRTSHFEFEADAKLAPNLVQDFCRIFEVTHAALEKNPLGLRLHAPKEGYFKVRLFKDSRGYHSAGGLLNAAGVYNRKTKEILVPFRSLGLRKANVAWVRQGKVYDPTTLVHEVTHQLLDQWLESAPIWFNEGMADLVGAARYDSGQLFFDRLEVGIKERILGRQKRNTRVRSLGASGFELPVNAQSVLLAPQSQFMGYPPAAPLEHAQVLHHYHVSLLLVQFALNDGKVGAQKLRDYLDTYRRSIEASELQSMEIPNKIYTSEDRKKVQAMLLKRMGIQRTAMKKALPHLLRGRSEKDFFADMVAYYKPKGIHLTPAEE